MSRFDDVLNGGKGTQQSRFSDLFEYTSPFGRKRTYQAVAQQPKPTQAEVEAQKAEEVDSLGYSVAAHSGNGLKALARNAGYALAAMANERLKNMQQYGDADFAGAEEYMQPGIAAAKETIPQAIQSIRNNDYLAHVHVNDGDSVLRQIGGDVIENAPQMIATALLGPVAGTGFMAGQIYGAGVDQALQRGMTLDRASAAGALDTGLQTPLEYIGMFGPGGKAASIAAKGAKAIFRGAKAGQRIDKLAGTFGKVGGWLQPAGNLNEKRTWGKAIAHGALSEAPTEGMQEFAEQFSLDAVDPNVSWGDVAYNSTVNPETWKNAGYSALSGGILGGAGGAVSVPIHNRQAKAYKEWQERLTKQIKEHLAQHPEDAANYETTKQGGTPSTGTPNTTAQGAISEAQNATPSYYADFAPEVQGAIQKYATGNVSPIVVAAIIRQESGGNPQAVSGVNAQGLMQLMPETAKEMGVTDPFDVDDNVRGGVKYYSWLKDQFNGSDVQALAAYNGGIGNVQKWLANGTWDGTIENVDQIPFEETRNYVKSIMGDVQQMQGQGTAYNPQQTKVGFTNDEQAAIIGEQKAQEQAKKDEYNRVANSEMARDYALELSRTTNNPALINEIQDAVRVGDNEKLEAIARENGYQDQDFTEASEEDESVSFNNSTAPAANANVHTETTDTTSTTGKNSNADNTTQTNNQRTNNIINEIANALMDKPTKQRIWQTHLPNINAYDTVDNTMLETSGDTKYSATVQKEFAAAEQEFQKLQNEPQEQTKEEQTQEETQPVEEVAQEQAPNAQTEQQGVNVQRTEQQGENAQQAQEQAQQPTQQQAQPQQQENGQKQAQTQEQVQQQGQAQEEPLYTPTKENRPDAQEHMRRVRDKLANEELPTIEEAQAVLADLDHMPDNKDTRNIRQHMEGIVRRDFSMFPKQAQAKMRALAEKEDASRARKRGQTTVVEQGKNDTTEQAVKTEGAAQNKTGTKISEQDRRTIEQYTRGSDTDGVKVAPDGTISITKTIGEKEDKLKVLVKIPSPEKGSLITFQFKEKNANIGKVEIALEDLISNAEQHDWAGTEQGRIGSVCQALLCNSPFFSEHFEGKGRLGRYIHDGNNIVKTHDFTAAMRDGVQAVIAKYNEELSKIAPIETEEQTQHATQEETQETAQEETQEQKTGDSESAATNEQGVDSKTSNQWKKLIRWIDSVAYELRAGNRNPKTKTHSWTLNIPSDYFKQDMERKRTVTVVLYPPEQGDKIKFMFTGTRGRKLGDIIVPMNDFVEHMSNAKIGDVDEIIRAEELIAKGGYTSEEGLVLKEKNLEAINVYVDSIFDNSDFVSGQSLIDGQKEIYKTRMKRGLRNALWEYYQNGYDVESGIIGESDKRFIDQEREQEKAKESDTPIAKTQETVDNDSRDSKQSGGETNGRDDSRGNAGTDESVHEEIEQPTDARSGKMGNRATGSNRVGGVRQDARSDTNAERNIEYAKDLGHTKEGDAHIAYINSLTYTVKVGEPRRVKLEAAGKDTGLGGIAADERVAAQNQMNEHGVLLVEWAKEHGISKTHTTAERRELRANIVDDYYNQGVYAKGKQAFLILGLPAAGKSSLADPLAKNMQAIIVDSDEFKKRLPEFENGAGANYLHEESSDMADALLDKVTDNGDNLVFPIVGKTADSLQAKIDLLKQKGYDVHLGYVDLPMDEALLRATNRYILEGRLVNLEYIQSVGNRPLDNFHEFKNHSDITDYALYNNDVAFEESPKLVEGQDYLSDAYQVKEAENDASGTERAGTGSGRSGEESRERSTETKRGTSQEHLVSGERAAVLRAGENQDDGQVRDSDTDTVRSGESETGEGVRTRTSDGNRGDNPRGDGMDASRDTDGCRTDFADIQNKKECGGNRQWQNHYLRNWAANTKGKGII